MDVANAPWSALDPRAHPFDLARLRAQIEPLVHDAARAARFDPRTLAHQIHDILPDAWARHWEMGLHGRVGAPPQDWRDAHATAQRVLAAVTRWRGFLEALSARFAGLRAVELSLEAVVERAAARVLPLVLELTNADDDWYRLFSSALGWFLEDLLGERADLAGIIAGVTAGRFSSWTAPDDDTQREAFAELGAAVAQALEPSDAIAKWLHIRPGVFNNLFRAPGAPPARPVLADGHKRFIEEVDRPRDPARADRMAAALTLCRDSAWRGLRLSFDQLAEWQAIVLGLPAPAAFRAFPAYGKGGRERYKLEPGTRRRFEDALADARGPTEHAVVRAARVFLDVCFFHPFDDGNARAARLALDHVLTSAGLALHDAAPAFVIPRAAGDIEGTLAFVSALEQLVGSRD